MSSSRELPAGWAWATLRELADIKGGITKGQRRSNGVKVRSVAYLRVANVQRAFLDLTEVKTIEAEEDEIADLLLRPGDILFNEGGDRDKLGRGWIWRGEIPECIHQNHVFRARLRHSELQPKLVSWYANFVGVSYFSEEGKQTTNLASINLTKLGGFPVPVPPIAEQARIVSEVEKQLTRLDAGIEALRRLQVHLKRYRASVLKAACEGKLVPNEAELGRMEGRDYEPADKLLERILKERRAKWEAEQIAKMRAAGKSPKDDGWKAKYQEPEPSGSLNVPLPPGWTWATFAQVSRRVTVGHVGPMKDEYVPSGVPFLRSQNVRENRFDPMGLLFITPDFHAKLAKSALRPGDIAVVRSGSVGISCVVPDSLPEANCADLVLVQEPYGVLPRYGAYYLNSLARRDIRAGQVGIALTHFNTKSVAALSVALPPLAEQERIVAEVERRLSMIDETEVVIGANMKRSARLRQTILKCAFEGKLVPQDPKDEPASALLQRVRAQHGTQAEGLSVRKHGRVRRRDNSVEGLP